jgi:hypothetical protein
MSFSRNSNISNWQDQNDCDCPTEDTDQQILDNLKSEMDEHARDLQARRDQHVAMHKKYADLKDDLGKELAKKKSHLAFKQNPRIVRCKKTNEAIEQMIDEIDCLRLTADPIAAHKLLFDLLFAELSTSVDELESLTNNRGCLEKVQAYRDCNAELKKWIRELRGKLQEEIPQVCNPELATRQGPCSDCSQNDPALFRLEMNLHRKIAKASDVSREVDPPRKSVLSKLPPTVLQNLEGMFAGDKSSSKKCCEKKTFS